MSSIVVFGAGGRAGRAAVAEARRRGHETSAVVRRPDRLADPDDHGVHVVAGDVTDAQSVARVAAGHDAAICAVHDPAADPQAFYPAVARSLVTGLDRAGVRRLVVVGLAPVLPTADGTVPMDVPGAPPHPCRRRVVTVSRAAGRRRGP